MVSSSYFYSVAQKKHFKCGRKEEEDTYAEVSCFPNPAFHSQIMSQNPAYGCPPRLPSRQTSRDQPSRKVYGCGDNRDITHDNVSVLSDDSAIFGRVQVMSYDELDHWAPPYERPRKLTTGDEHAYENLHSMPKVCFFLH